MNSMKNQEEITTNLDNGRHRMRMIAALANLRLLTDKETMVLANWTSRVMRRYLDALGKLRK